MSLMIPPALLLRPPGPPSGSCPRPATMRRRLAGRIDGAGVDGLRGGGRLERDDRLLSAGGRWEARDARQPAEHVRETGGRTGGVERRQQVTGKRSTGVM